MQSKVTKIKAKNRKKKKTTGLNTEQNKTKKPSARLAAIITHNSFEFDILVDMLRSRNFLQIYRCFFSFIDQIFGFISLRTISGL